MRFAVLPLLLVPGLAWGHAKLEASVPPAGSVVPAAPAELRLDFSEAIEPSFSKVTITGPSGVVMAAGVPHVDPADNHHLLVPVPKLAAGTYSVSWHAVSIDTHRTHGTYRFTVAP